MGRCPASSSRIDFAVRRHGIHRTLWLLTRCFAFIALAAWPARPAPAGALTGGSEGDLSFWRVTGRVIATLTKSVALGGAKTVQLTAAPTASLDLGISHSNHGWVKTQQLGTGGFQTRICSSPSSSAPLCTTGVFFSGSNLVWPRLESVARTSVVTVKLPGATILADPSITTSRTVTLDGWGAPSAGSGGPTPTADNEAPLRPPSASWESASMPINSGMSLWRASVAALAAANIMDVQSSWGKGELNPALAGGGGTFGARGALLKAGVIGGAVALQFLILRHGPSKRLCRAVAAINFGGAGLAGSSAVRNWRVADR